MKEQKRPGERMWHLYKTGGITPAIASIFGAQNAQQMAFIRSVMKEQRKHSLFEIPLLELDTVVFDLETTGFSPQHGDEIISIGAVAMKGREILRDETFYRLIRPDRTISQEIVKLTGITNEMASDAPELITVLQQFLEFVHKRVLVVHGSGHDKSFLNSALWKTSRATLTHRMLDTMMIAKWLDPKRADYGLDGLLEDCQIPTTQRHHALEDSMMTAQLYASFIQEITQRQVTTLGDLYAYLSRY